VTLAISKMDAAGTLTGDELVEVSQLSTTVTMTATTLSALASDNSYNDSANGFVTGGFEVGMRVKVTGFTGNVANNISSATITALTAGKMTIGGTDGDVIVDDAAGESVTITKWDTRRTTLDDIVALASAAGYNGGVQSIPILASAMTARTTNGAAAGLTETTTNKVMLSVLDFDAGTDEFAQFLFPMPKSWDESTITAQFIWTAASGSGDVVWGIQAVAISNDDALDAAFGTAQTVTDTLTATGDQCTTSFTSAVTIGGTPAEGDLVCFQVYRDANNGSDTLGVDARLIGIRLNITTNAADDS
jgi:hypothetical protein